MYKGFTLVKVEEGIIAAVPRTKYPCTQVGASPQLLSCQGWQAAFGVCLLARNQVKCLSITYCKLQLK